MSLLGPLALRVGATRQKLPFSGSTKRLFVYLAGHANEALRRDVLLDELWTDVERARAQSNLNTAIWRIKQGLQCFDGFSIQTMDDLVCLSVSAPAWIDSHQLEQALAQVAHRTQLSLEDYTRILQSVGLCRGPFLDGCSDHWVLPLREKFSALHIRALTLLMRDRAARRDFDVALEHGRAILMLDAFREGAQREVIWLYALNGQRAKAITQFRKLSHLLQQELGIDPMPETVALHNKILHAKESMLKIAASSLSDGSLEQATVPAVCLCTGENGTIQL